MKEAENFKRAFKLFYGEDRPLSVTSKETGIPLRSLLGWFFYKEVPKGLTPEEAESIRDEFQNKELNKK